MPEQVSPQKHNYGSILALSCMHLQLRKTLTTPPPTAPHSKQKGKVPTFSPILASQKSCCSQKIQGLILNISHNLTYLKDHIKEIWATFVSPTSHLGYSPEQADDHTVRTLLYRAEKSRTIPDHGEGKDYKGTVGCIQQQTQLCLNSLLRLALHQLYQ